MQNIEPWLQFDGLTKETRRTQAELTSTYIGLQSSPIAIYFAIPHYDSLHQAGGAIINMIIKNKDCLVSLKGSCDPHKPLLLDSISARKKHSVSYFYKAVTCAS